MLDMHEHESECGYLRAMDARISRLRAAVARHPDPRDPEYDEDAADALAEIAKDQAIEDKYEALLDLDLNEFLQVVRSDLGGSSANQVDAILYELAKILVERRAA